MLDSSSKMNDKRVVIVGGGPAGLTAAYQLAKTDVKSIVLEKDQILGGISRTVNYKDYYFDIGGHRFFTKNKEVEDIWKEVLSDDLILRERISRIYYEKKFFHYPIRAFNALFGLGVWNSIMIMTSYLQAKIFPSKEEDTLEQWVSNRFGKHLFNIFFKTYTEKVWGIPCSEIRAEWAAQRIKGLSLLTAVKNALIKPKISNGDKKDVIKTLIEEFLYPKFGPGMMWETVADKIKDNGSQVWLGSEVEGVRCLQGRVEALEVRRNGKIEVISGNDFISSMPIRETIQKFKPAVPKEVLEAANDLKYRDFLTVALIVNKPELFPDNWIYIHDINVKVGRIQNFKNWSPFMVPNQDKTCLGLEYFCFEGDSLWTMPDEQLIELGKYELEVLGFVNSNEVEDGTVVRMPKAYPVYDATYQESLTVVRKFLDSIENLQLVGRNGQHKYNNQDHSMLTAMMAVENIQGADHDLWQVNEEQEYLEEISIEPNKKAALEKILTTLLSRLDKLGFATALGSVFGLLVFLATLFLNIASIEGTPPTLHLLNQYFFGYTVSIKGAFIGMAYSFSWGFIFGWLFAYLRNLFIALFIYRAKRKAELLKFKDFIDHF
ncbi:MAG: NAD(P)/FAD-dependent oxidoreductase [Thermodesulfobacteriota bacterium]|nr:NAD(P)/FAD-dependent oxidoreductase [Thermodesulfobacteriota bacterium]